MLAPFQDNQTACGRRIHGHCRCGCGGGDPMLDREGLEPTCGRTLPRAEAGLKPNPSPRLWPAHCWPWERGKRSGGGGSGGGGGGGLGFRGAGAAWFLALADRGGGRCAGSSGAPLAPAAHERFGNSVTALRQCRIQGYMEAGAAPAAAAAPSTCSRV